MIHLEFNKFLFPGYSKRDTVLINRGDDLFIYNGDNIHRATPFHTAFSQFTQEGLTLEFQSNSNSSSKSSRSSSQEDIEVNVVDIKDEEVTRVVNHMASANISFQEFEKELIESSKVQVFSGNQFILDNGVHVVRAVVNRHGTVFECPLTIRKQKTYLNPAARNMLLNNNPVYGEIDLCYERILHPVYEQELSYTPIKNGSRVDFYVLYQPFE